MLSPSLLAAGLVDTETLIKGLRSGVIRQAGLDVYENEAPYFFKDCSDTPVQVGSRPLSAAQFHCLVGYNSVGSGGCAPVLLMHCPSPTLFPAGLE